MCTAGGPNASDEPVLDVQTGDAGEVADVARDQGEVAGEGDRGDAHVGLVEAPTLRLQPGAKRPVDLRGGFVERQHGEGAGPYPSGEVAERGHWRTVMSAGPVRQALIDKGLIYSPDHGQVDFTVPHFGDFMRRKHPLGSLD